MPRAELYLITPVLADAAGFAPTLAAAVEAGRPASVLLRLAATDDQTAKAMVRMLAPIAQKAGAACLVEGFAAIIARAGADGIHVTDGRKGLDEALSSFKPERIVGAGRVRSKHDAMLNAEKGVDYVMIGEPAADGRPPPLEAIVERVAWWAELFEIPCVAYAPDLAAVPLLADAGADFIALGEAVWSHDRGPAAALSLAARLLSQREGA